MKKLIIINIVGLSNKNLKESKPPNILEIITDGSHSTLLPTFPAVTCSVQASLLSGRNPSEHGIVSNGFFDKDSKQISFWEQYSSLVQKPRIWDLLKQKYPNLKTAVLFWQNSLFINSDIVITPKPVHLENKMVMWCYSKPVNFYEKIVEQLGEFDLKSYWGPFSSIKSSKWIIEASKITIEAEKPDLLFVYLPHLDYAAQKNGPESKEYYKAIKELDQLIGEFTSFLNSKFHDEYEIVILSEYGFNSVNSSLSPNRILRNEGLLKTRTISGKDYIDFEMSKAFTVTDHQIAHIHIKPKYIEDVKNIFKNDKNVSKVLDCEKQKMENINHSRSGELILCSKLNSWFNYYWWENIDTAPEFVHNVDIHRKPGYDPLELFLDIKTKKISQNTELVKGSHGVFEPKNLENLPFIGSSSKMEFKEITPITGVASKILNYFD